jgi:mono/diheme cytochrome c family protein
MNSRMALGAALVLALSLAAGGAQAADAVDGKATYEKWCAPCHAPGISHPGTHALQAKYAGQKSGVLLEWKDLTPEYVKAMVRTGISVMPHFRKTEISAAELDALADYVASEGRRAR